MGSDQLVILTIFCALTFYLFTFFVYKPICLFTGYTDITKASLNNFGRPSSTKHNKRQQNIILMILGLRDYKDHSSPRVWSCLATFTTLPSNVFLFRLKKKIREIEFQFHEIFNVQMFVYVYLIIFTGILEILRRWLQNYTFQSALGAGQPLSRPHGKI